MSGAGRSGSWGWGVRGSKILVPRMCAGAFFNTQRNKIPLVLGTMTTCIQSSKTQKDKSKAQRRNVVAQDGDQQGRPDRVLDEGDEEQRDRRRKRPRRDPEADRGGGEVDQLFHKGNKSHCQTSNC